MRTMMLPAYLLGMLLVLFYGAPAQAQPVHTFVSGTGNDANACTRASPCLTLQYALSQTKSGGEITVLDSGDFGPVMIGKSISIVAEGAEAGILPTAFTSDVININALPSDVINLRGLVIDGAGNGGTGIRFRAGGSLHIQKCVLRNLQGFGIYADTGNAAQLHVSDTVISTNGAGYNGGGIAIVPSSGSGTVDVVLDRVHVENNISGVKLESGGNTSGGKIQTFIINSVLAGNKIGAGLTAQGFVSLTTATVIGTQIIGNGTGVQALGAHVAIILNNSTIQTNGTAITRGYGASVFSYQNNDIINNDTPGSAPTPISLH